MKGIATKLLYNKLEMILFSLDLIPDEEYEARFYIYTYMMKQKTMEPIENGEINNYKGDYMSRIERKMEVRTVEDLFIILQNFKNTVTLHPNFIFRGQSKAEWNLQPSFTRILEEKKLTRDKALKFEHESVVKFAMSARHTLPRGEIAHLPHGGIYDYFGWFPVMQNYSVPTRILDWSMSPWVALYFACLENKTEDDGTLWIANFKIIDDTVKKEIEQRYDKLDEKSIEKIDDFLKKSFGVNGGLIFPTFGGLKFLTFI